MRGAGLGTAASHRVVVRQELMVVTIAPHAFGGGGLLRQGGVRIGWDGVGWG